MTQKLAGALVFLATALAVVTLQTANAQDNARQRKTTTVRKPSRNATTTTTKINSNKDLNETITAEAATTESASTASMTVTTARSGSTPMTSEVATSPSSLATTASNSSSSNNCPVNTLSNLGPDKDDGFQKWKGRHGRKRGNSTAETKSYKAFQRCECYVKTLHGRRRKQQKLHFEVAEGPNCGISDDEFVSTQLGGNYPPEASGSDDSSNRFLTVSRSRVTTASTLIVPNATTATITATTTTTTTTTTTSTVTIPTNFNWNNWGKVGPVRNQGSCGCCWSFSAAGALEGHLAIQTGTMVPLSNQNLIDCSRSYRNSGCSGGLPMYAFNYVLDSKGINSYSDYTFTGKDTQPCTFNSQKTYAPLANNNFVLIPKGDENALLKAVMVGPVSIGINAGLESFKHYQSGVYDDPSCTANLNHAVLLVGWGVDTSNANDPVPYWMVKNSWGTNWGESGYVRMKRGVNMCGLANSAVFPVLVGENPNAPASLFTSSNTSSSLNADKGVSGNGHHVVVAGANMLRAPNTANALVCLASLLTLSIL